MQGAIDRFFVSTAGAFLILGWLADEGHEATRLTLAAGDHLLDVPFDTVLRHARPDIESHVREGVFDYGFVAVGHVTRPSDLQQPLTVWAVSDTGLFEAAITPEVVSDKRLLDTLLIVAAGARSHAGKDASLSAFLRSTAGDVAMGLFHAHVESGIRGHRVFRFRPRPVARTMVTVLFGTAEPVLLQPVLFRQHGLDVGEWIYVCNSPEDVDSALRYGRLMADLYDLPITVVAMADNVGFGAANNLAISLAASDTILLANPDVFPMAAHAAALQAALEGPAAGADTLRGGLLFYDEDTLMHGGMYVDADPCLRGTVINGSAAARAAHSDVLLRVEHFDKGVPFEEAAWTDSRVVPAITGALMAFDRKTFERFGGFSTRYIYGHYEDADLSLRWGDRVGPVRIDPRLRLIHLEGQGSRPRGPQYHAAAIVNRHFFSFDHGDRVRPSQAQPAARLGGG